MASSTTNAPPTTRQEFEEVFPKLVDDLLNHAKAYNIPPNALAWYEKSLKHNTLGGKYNRGMSVLDTTKILHPTPPSATLTFQSLALGWLAELLQAFFLVSDDIMDASHTRRGSPCWYLMPGVNMVAINDAFMLESSIYNLLKIHFRALPCYVDLLELFHEITFKTEVGQLCDLLTAPEEHVDLDNFSMEKFTFIVIYKTAYYSFYLPVALSLHLNGLGTPKNLQQAESILVPLGEYFQAQDDYLDNFASPEVLGKIGTDIQDNKCSWLVNTALKRASAAQRKVLEENYGRKDQEKEREVKRVYEELKLEEVFKAYEEERVKEIRERIAKVDESEGLKRGVFESFLNKIYKRKR